MKKSTIVLLAFLAGVAMMIASSVSINNNIIQKEESVKAGWSQVENVYQRRLDLIPNLVSTVKGYAKHEKETLENVIQARNQAVQIPKSVLDNPESLKKFQNAQDSLGSALSRLMVVVEKYPDLKANENFKDLQVQLEGTENRIAVERKRFNDFTKDYNSYIRIFPQSFIASLRGFQQKPYFEAQAGAANAPKVEF